MIDNRADTPQPEPPFHPPELGAILTPDQQASLNKATKLLEKPDPQIFAVYDFTNPSQPHHLDTIKFDSWVVMERANQDTIVNSDPTKFKLQIITRRRDISEQQIGTSINEQTISLVPPIPEEGAATVQFEGTKTMEIGGMGLGTPARAFSEQMREGLGQPQAVYASGIDQLGQRTNIMVYQKAMGAEPTLYQLKHLAKPNAK